MSLEYAITRARPSDIPSLPAIELAAAQLLTGHAPDSVLNETTGVEEFFEAQHLGRLWIALVEELPVGFAHIEILEPLSAHLKEVDVHPQYGRRGIGTALVRRICKWAAHSGYRSVTLTTFRDVPWNAPFYARLGFEVIPADELSSALRLIMHNESIRGLDRRVAMRWVCRR
jgi:GNAT superfamily N-acetyltransferase